MLRLLKSAFKLAYQTLSMLGRAIRLAGWARTVLYTGAVAGLVFTAAPIVPDSALDARGHYDLGLQQMSRQEYFSGISHLQRAATLAPRNLDYQLTLSEARLFMREPEKALETLRRAWRLEPSRWTVYLTAAAHADLKLYDSSLELLTEAKSAELRGRRWNSESREAVARKADMQIAQCYIRKNEAKKAIDQLTSSLATDAALGLTAEPHFWLGVAYWMDGNKELALDRFQAAIARDPNDSGSLYNIACYYAVNNQPLRALSYLEQAVDRGFYEPEYFEYDSDMDSLRLLPQFQRLAQRVRSRAALMPTAGPRSERAVRDLVEDLESRRFSAR